MKNTVPGGMDWWQKSCLYLPNSSSSTVDMWPVEDSGGARGGMGDMTGTVESLGHDISLSKSRLGPGCGPLEEAGVVDLSPLNGSPSFIESTY